MQFFKTLLFASSVAAQASVVLDAISSISSATGALQTAVEGFQGAEQAADLQTASEAVISAINDGNSAVEPIETLSEGDALNLAGPVQDLADLTSAAVDATIAQRDAFDAAGVSSIVLDQLTQIQSAATTFSATVVSKVPEGLQPIAQQLSQQITDALQRGVDAYSDATPPDGSSSSTTGSSTATSSGTGSMSYSMSSPTATGTGSVPTGTGSMSMPAPTAAPTAPSPPITTGAAAANIANLGAVVAAGLLVAVF